ncbi:CIC11C00000004230 [Sungouiella intermedia]|uniref:CIC11C00000004230 n=1 Tax=Sungouiella intermedia TaxID=45354 RepID=A0A1L0CYE6_9ASCO|nr:CIC11C00000004230 [[Candida] intermedia]
MEALETVLKFFSLETLDTRLNPPQDEGRKKQIINRANPTSRWSTLEFKFYLVVFAVMVPLMYKTAMDASNETNPNYPRFEHLLSQGWMFGRKVDNSDQQYSFFRNNYWLLWGLLGCHVGLRKVVSSITPHKRTTFDFVFGLIYLFALHGTNVVKIAFHVFIMYALATRIHNSRASRICIWVYGVLSLFMNERIRNLTFNIAMIDQGFHGVISRWDVFYNFTLLRMLSFGLDYLERKDNPKSQVLVMPDDLDDRARLTAPIPIEEYSFFNYFSYLGYAPLFIGGPIITFNDYIYQSNYFQANSTKNVKRTLIYGARLLFCILVMEFLLHFMYVVAVSKTKAWDGDTPFQLSMLGLFNLNIIWLKLLIPWRLFRFWSLLDGVDPPENMIRCMDNNYLALAFWRGWHRSYNRWVVRYIYVPLGGGGGPNGGGGYATRIANSLLVFSFVAVWHDIELKLLMWGWLVVLFLLPEIFATMYFRRYAGQPWFRHLCGIGAVCNIWMMMLANLFGFCLGKDGTMALLNEMFRTAQGFKFFILASATLYVGVQVMFELREAEKRRGVDVKC